MGVGGGCAIVSFEDKRNKHTPRGLGYYQIYRLRHGNYGQLFAFPKNEGSGASTILEISCL